MINIPYTGIQPAGPYAMQQLPIMPVPVRRGSVAEQMAAQVLPQRPPQLPHPPNILSQFAAGTGAPGAIEDFLKS